jgi:hypothetical protein
MASRYLDGLSAEERESLKQTLWSQQKGNCFICGDPIDLTLHQGSLDIDHVEPLSTGGHDEPSNFALAHASCNRSKRAANLQVARALARFDRIQEECLQQTGKGANLGHVLTSFSGARFPARLRCEGQTVELSFPELGDNAVRTLPILCDQLSGFRSFFSEIPIEYLHHDTKINPRPVGASLRGFVEEFFRHRPQLHIALAWVATDDRDEPPRFAIFDGQHKVAAQVLLGVRRLPVRVFIDPNLDVLLETNFNAGDKLRQVAFGTSVKRQLGSTLYADLVERYQRERGLSNEDLSFSERDLVAYFKGAAPELKRYIIDAARNSVTQHPENKLMSFVDFGGRGQERPLSYSTIEKTFYSFFIYQELLNLPLNHRVDEGENPRLMEREQLVSIMNLVAEELLIGRFDLTIGTRKIEHRLQAGELLPDAHIAAYRMCKEEILYTWLRYIHQVIKSFFINIGQPIDEERLFQYRFPDQLWTNVRNFLRNLRALPLWINRDLSATVFGGKQVHNFWQEIFETGRAPTGQKVMPHGINLMEMIKGA